jgi:hypothetical protein
MKIVARFTTPRMRFWPVDGTVRVVYWRPMRQTDDAVHCALCAEGMCCQRTEWGPGWDSKIVIHGHLPN